MDLQIVEDGLCKLTHGGHAWRILSTVTTTFQVNAEPKQEFRWCLCQNCGVNRLVPLKELSKELSYELRG